jgi:hypothetical protein
MLALAVLLAGCTGEVRPLGLGEPIRVHDATLRRTEMPGGPDAEGPAVTAVETIGGIWSQGQLDRAISGRTSDDAHAIGLAIADLGTGYWVLPVGARDPAFPGERHFEVELDVGGSLPPGVHVLRAVAIDGEGNAGAWSDLEFCAIDPRVPTDLSACDPTLPPPAAVIALEWDEDADLDLVLVTPDGKTVDARHPTTALVPEGEEIPRELLNDPHTGRLDGDSLAECIPDGRNAESVTWREAPLAGQYNVYVNLYDACGHASARFGVVTYRREEIAEGEFRLVRSDAVTGVVLAPSANGGAGQPLYVTSIVL